MRNIIWGRGPVDGAVDRCGRTCFWGELPRGIGVMSDLLPAYYNPRTSPDSFSPLPLCPPRVAQNVSSATLSARTSSPRLLPPPPPTVAATPTSHHPLPPATTTATPQAPFSFAAQSPPVPTMPPTQRHPAAPRPLPLPPTPAPTHPSAATTPCKSTRPSSRARASSRST